MSKYLEICFYRGIASSRRALNVSDRFRCIGIVFSIVRSAVPGFKIVTMRTMLLTVNRNRFERII